MVLSNLRTFIVIILSSRRISRYSLPDARLDFLPCKREPVVKTACDHPPKDIKSTAKRSSVHPSWIYTCRSSLAVIVYSDIKTNRFVMGSGQLYCAAFKLPGQHRICEPLRNSLDWCVSTAIGLAPFYGKDVDIRTALSDVLWAVPCLWYYNTISQSQCQ